MINGFVVFLFSFSCFVFPISKQKTKNILSGFGFAKFSKIVECVRHLHVRSINTWNNGNGWKKSINVSLVFSAFFLLMYYKTQVRQMWQTLCTMNHYFIFFLNLFSPLFYMFFWCLAIALHDNFIILIKTNENMQNRDSCFDRRDVFGPIIWIFSAYEWETLIICRNRINLWNVKYNENNKQASVLCSRWPIGWFRIFPFKMQIHLPWHLPKIAHYRKKKQKTVETSNNVCHSTPS